MTSNPNLRIKALRIVAIRGIVDLELPLNSRNVVLQGANGDGKSSILDALEFVLLGRIGHLDGKQTLSLARHGKHVRSKEGIAEVSLQLSDAGVVLRKLGGTATYAPSAEAYLLAAQRGTFLLRRAQLLRFIHAIPAERFRELAALIGIERLDGLELALKRTADSLKGSLDAESQLARVRGGEIEAITGIEVTAINADRALSFVNQELAKIARPAVTSLDDAASVAAALVNPDEVSARTRQLVLAEGALSAIAHASAGKILFSQVKHTVDRVLAFRGRGEAARVAALEPLLRESADYVSAYRPTQCPICEQVIDPDSLLGALTRRHALLLELTEEASELRSTAAARAAAARDLRRQLAGLADSLQSMADAAVIARLQSVMVTLGKVAESLSASDLLAAGTLPTDNDAPDGELTEALASAREAVESRRLALAPKAEETVAADAMQRILRVQSLLAELGRAKRRLQRATELHRRAGVALKVLVTSKNDVVVDIYNAIKADVDRFYAALHPNEPHGNVVLDISRRASTMLWIDSFGVEQQDPRAFSSEGHLDSLGLCIFLAFANTFRGACNLLALDDVVMSIDAGHRKRIASLLIAECDAFQLLITTHDRIWAQELRGAQKALGREAEFMNLQITSWSVDGGPILSNYVPVWSRVAEKLANGDLAGAGGDTRRSFEWILQELAERLQAAVPFEREPRYTAEVLYQPVRQRLTKLLKAVATPTIAALEGTRLFGNMLTHATIDTDAVSREEVAEFAAAVEALGKVMSCTACGAFLSYDQAGKAVLCRNPKCKARTVYPCD